MALLPLENPKGKAKETRIITSTTQQKFLITKKRPQPISVHKAQSRKAKHSYPPMEEMMMVMMKIRSHEQTHDQPDNNNLNLNIPSTTSTSPTWKLYENPFYTSHHKPQQNHHHQKQQQQQDSTDHHQRQIHRLHLPISARKIAASFWDLTFIKPFMESELEMARAQIAELKAELECERKSRKKMESLNKRLARELSEERKGREALERVCEELAKEISCHKAEFSRMKREMEEERKMLRTAEVIREERVQMKLAEAKFLLEEKFSELETVKKMGTESSSGCKKEGKINYEVDNTANPTSFGEKLRFVLGEKLPASVNIGNVHSMAVMQRKACPEAENPHIKRGIKGFVEFPKVVRAIGCRSSKHLGSKLECQKAQLKILLKQKGPVRFNGLIAS
ncbi:UNVERIFIED_CONTAM: protein BRANCHLESS TRICHOME [Sesamum latifolium]|uniref:Protein BRANCHLESS TRICHOME n=1 Tax=Sesamum latifolium TaxID=2727402 RepID=A0AAW2X3B6_9LAMI